MLLPMEGNFLHNLEDCDLLFWKGSELWTLLPMAKVVGISEIHHQFYSKSRLQPTPSKSSINQSQTYVKKPTNTSNKFRKHMKNQQTIQTTPSHTKNMCHFSSSVTSTRPNNRMNLQNRGPGIWQMHPNARQAIRRCPGTTAGGIAIDTEMHLGTKISNHG